MFEQRHYERIAETIAEHLSSPFASPTGVADLVIDLCVMFTGDNPDFDEGKFVRVALGGIERYQHKESK